LLRPQKCPEESAVLNERMSAKIRISATLGNWSRLNRRLVAAVDRPNSVADAGHISAPAGRNFGDLSCLQVAEILAERGGFDSLTRQSNP
jgi:hypothetical protein